MIYKLISDGDEFLDFKFDHEQIKQLLEKSGSCSRESRISVNNSPRRFGDVYSEPLNFEFIPMFKKQKEKPIPDLSVRDGRLFLSQESYRVLYSLIKNDGELLPVKYQKGDGYFFTPLSVASVDPQVTKKNEWGDIVSLGFEENSVKNYAVFRTEYDGFTGLYCQENIKQAIEDNNLTGLYITTDLANIFPEDRSTVEKAN
ncbi:hypothetical protein [Aliikangiella sp. IMCC44359]|uniref:hypothetical protein n=1 Tax=Aliikangiella sp. IMCC44359 TaxID=3459125 RepID=UPI00403A81E0